MKETARICINILSKPNLSVQNKEQVCDDLAFWIKSIY